MNFSELIPTLPQTCEGGSRAHSEWEAYLKSR